VFVWALVSVFIEPVCPTGFFVPNNCSFMVTELHQPTHFTVALLFGLNSGLSQSYLSPLWAKKQITNGGFDPTPKSIDVSDRKTRYCIMIIRLFLAANEPYILMGCRCTPLHYKLHVESGSRECIVHDGDHISNSCSSCAQPAALPLVRCHSFAFPVG